MDASSRSWCSNHADLVEQTGLCFFPEVHSLRGIVVSERNHRNSSDTRRPFCTTGHRAARNQPLRAAASDHTGAHMQSQLPRDANAIAYTSMLCYPAFSDPGLASDIQSSTQKPQFAHCCSPQPGRQHIPGFRILNLSDPIPLSCLLPFSFMLM